ncbi:MAG: choice-of-anchor D domain-containing protein [Deltaproteobacteria bacterium]|nr:choice-of-anchor D domain-containing protein [Deltaproteobacteria bacterium]
MRSPLVVLALATVYACGDARQERLCGSGQIEVDGRCESRPSADAGQDADAVGLDSQPPDAHSLADSASDAEPVDSEAVDAESPDSQPDAGDALPVDGGDDGGNGDAEPVDSGFESAFLSTSEIDFGRAVVGTVVERFVRVENRSASALLVRPGVLTGDQALSAETPTTSPVALSPGEGFDLIFRYSPTGSSLATAQLAIQLCDGGCEATISLRGEGVVDPLVCNPPSLDFGFVPPGACVSRSVDCTNVSSYDVHLAHADVVIGTALEFSAMLPVAPTVVLPQATLSTEVTFCPTNLGPESGGFALTINHPDPSRATSLVTFRGAGGGPDVECMPTSLELGFIPVGRSAIGTIACTNQGTAPLAVGSVAFVQGTTSELSFSASVGGASINFPNTISPGVTFSIEVTFTPLAAGDHETNLELASNELAEPVRRIRVHAAALPTGAGCSVDFEPAAIDFGLVAIGTSVRETATVVNVGTGACGVSITPPAGAFAVSGTLVGVIDPGQRLSVDVVFTPVAVATFSGVLIIDSNDLTRPSVDLSLTGSGSDSGVTHDGPIDFGVVPLGCAQEITRELTVTNEGSALLLVASVGLVLGSSPAFTLEAVPSPFPLLPGLPVPITVRFQPTQPGSYSGTVAIELAEGTIYVDVAGSAAPSGQVLDRFVATGASAVDVLLVVDDSCSMQDYQDRLAASLPDFVSIGDSVGSDYHIGIITTDATSPLVGRLRGTPAFVTPLQVGRAASLAANAAVGINGSPDEQGLFAAAEATSNPSLLAGPNAGFLRADGQLSVVVLSDEDEQSTFTVASLLDRIARRPIGAPGVTIHGITSGLAGCGFAQPTPRYSDAIRLTSGIEASICEPDYTPLIAQIARAVFNEGAAVFPLSAVPAAGSIELRVDGALVPSRTGTISAWYLDPSRRLVAFARGHAPAQGADVEIRYSLGCVPATCGNSVLESGEGCDDGDADDLDGCPTTCRPAVCGDSFVRSGFEQCDDGNTFPGDGCNDLCVIEGCGNGILEAAEACDQGSANSDVTPNACRTSCTLPACHDGVVDNGEACDDGNTSDVDECAGECLLPRCGDGFVRANVEECDDGNGVDDDSCSNACVWNVASFNVTSISAPFVPTGGTHLVALEAGDDAVEAVAIGFPFDFLGVPVATVHVTTNGLIAFEPSNANEYINEALPSASDPNAFVAWWWDDLNPHQTGVPPPSLTTAVSGASPNRVRSFTMIDVPKFGATSANPVRVSAEIRLHESTNIVEIHYGPTFGAAAEFSASVGWESSGGIFGADVLGCSPNCRLADWPTDTVLRYSP